MREPKPLQGYSGMVGINPSFYTATTLQLRVAATGVNVTS